MEWQPIETAPKDGTEFLAYDKRTKKMDVCHWIGRPMNWPSQVQMDGEYGPYEDQFGHSWRDISHWMPLPPPPAIEQEGE
jgi:hypothetical protein